MWFRRLPRRGLGGAVLAEGGPDNDTTAACAVARMTDLSSEGWCEPANAVDFLDWEISRRRGRDPDANDWLDGMDDYQVVKLPLEIADTLLECAKRGMQRRGAAQGTAFDASRTRKMSPYSLVCTRLSWLLEV